MALTAPISKGLGRMSGQRSCSELSTAGARSGGGDLAPVPQRSIHSWMPHPSVVAEARALTRKVLDLYGVKVVDDVVTVVSELVTNAVKVSLPDWTVTLRLLIDDEAVLVAVHDESDELPEIREVGTDESEGRGLLIVESLSDGNCGYTLGLYGGKATWALIKR